MRGSNFTYLVKQGIASVWHNRIMSFASFCILMVSLLLIGLSVLIGFDIGIIIGNVENKNEIMVFVDMDATQAEITHISDVLNANPYRDKVTYKSKEEALDEMREIIGDRYAPLFDYMGDYNPMPTTFTVSITDLTMIEAVVEEFSQIDRVERVEAPYAYAEFITNVRNTLAVIGSAVILALITVCFVIVYNTARTSVFARRMEISIMKHVGATNAFIKTPFFIEGMFIGVLAGTASWGLTKIAYESVVSLFTGDIGMWEVFGLVNIIQFSEVQWTMLALNCIAGALLGAVGTVFSMGKHLKV